MKKNPLCESEKSLIVVAVEELNTLEKRAEAWKYACLICFAVGILVGAYLQRFF